MDYKKISAKELAELRDRINTQILRRGTFRWWDPLTRPTIGTDKSPPMSIPDNNNVAVTELTYTINNPSNGSIEPTRNVGSSSQALFSRDTSASKLDMDEIKNMIAGLAKMQDINLYYGRDEIARVGFRDMADVERVLSDAESDIRNTDLHNTNNSATIVDPNGGMIDRVNPDWPDNINVSYPMEDGLYVMPSGEIYGEEIQGDVSLNEMNFFDDYGAEPGDGDFHPMNPSSMIMDNSSYTPTPNPRNPYVGQEKESYPVYAGIQTSCNNACTGLCSLTCDNQCSESCTITCWSRCGNACTASCGNSCTGCSSSCYSSCHTKCQTNTGHSCVTSGAKTVKIETTGGHDGIVAENTLSSTHHTCNGCSYSCQFMPNKKTTCWDAGCMGQCFASCDTYCSTSCFGGCIGNEQTADGSYKGGGGNGRGCSAGCTMNCIGTCSESCSGYCSNACFSSCKEQCVDNCSQTCSTNCGNGCDTGCTMGCTGCSTTCSGSCIGGSDSRDCISCGSIGGCTSSCQHDCNKNCIGFGCRSICGLESSGACEANCRMNCSSASCTSMCSNACVDMCSECVNTCGMQCGACSSMCSTGCESECNITCSSICVHSCSTSCVQSCSEECGGCSDLCYSCVGMCIGVCSLSCDNGCMSCTNSCGWWCDTACIKECFSGCTNLCINSCSGSCVGTLNNETKLTGSLRNPPSEGYQYPDPQDRFEERDSYILFGDPSPTPPDEILLSLTFNESMIVDVTSKYNIEYIVLQSIIGGGIYEIPDDFSISANITAVENNYKDIPLTNEMPLFAIYVEFTDGDEIDYSNIFYDIKSGYELKSVVINKNIVMFIIEIYRYDADWELMV